MRDSTLIHPLTLLLFAGRSLDVISGGVCVCVCVHAGMCVGVLVKYVFVRDFSTPNLITQMMEYSWNYEKLLHTHTHTHTYTHACMCVGVLVKYVFVHDFSTPNLITQMMEYSWNYEKLLHTHTHTCMHTCTLSLSRGG